MKIFFAASIKGGREHQPTFDFIVRELQKYGTVHAPYVGDAALSEYGETGLSDTSIVERERAALSDADLVVAEVTTPSLGVGYLLAVAAQAGKKIIALYQGENLLKLSSMVKGDTRINVQLYKNNEQLVALLEASALK